MTRSGKILVAAAVLTVLVLWAVLKVTSRSEAVSGSAERERGAEMASPPESNGRASEDRRARKRAVARLRTYLRGARTSVPRLAQVGAQDAAAQQAAPTPRPRRLDLGRGKPRDRSPEPRPGSQRLSEELAKRIDQAEESAEKCLGEWAAQDSSLDAGVMLAFSVDKQGLQEVWIQDRTEVPSGPLACIANSVYPIDWGGLTETPINVTVPVRYAHDAGVLEGSVSPDSAP